MILLDNFVSVLNEKNNVITELQETLQQTHNVSLYHLIYPYNVNVITKKHLSIRAYYIVNIPMPIKRLTA